MNENCHGEMDRLVAQLKPAAMVACDNAHAIYSDFPVGSSLLSDNGTLFSGCNVENSSYGLTICAERNALAQAVANGVKPGGVIALLIYTPGQVAHTPCGACRQVMHELLPGDAVVISSCDSEQTRVWKLIELIPDPFKF